MHVGRAHADSSMDAAYLSWLGMLVATRANLDRFCWSTCSWPAHHLHVGIKLPLSCTVHICVHVYDVYM